MTKRDGHVFVVARHRNDLAKADSTMERVWEGEMVRVRRSLGRMAIESIPRP